MSGALAERELEQVRGGAALVISLDAWKRLSGWRCTDEGNKRRDEELQLWTSPGQKMPADENRQLQTSCLQNPEDKGSRVVNWRYGDLAKHVSSFTVVPQHCCVEDLVQRSVFTSSAASAAQCPKETTRTRLIFNMKDIFTLMIKNIDNSITMDCSNRFMIIWDKDTSSPLCSESYCSHDFIENECLHTSDNNNVSCDNNSPSDDNNNSEDHHRETAPVENLNVRARKSLLKSRHSDSQPGESCGRERSGKTRKSVSFHDDVMVYLFDQESPTMELHSEPCTSLPEATLEDSGLEWDDDFSQLCTLSPPTGSWRRSEVSGRRRYLPPQSCLFLTTVAESDLEP